MSRSKANELLQKLNQKMNDLFSGKKTDFNANKAYEICRQVVKEVDEEEGGTNNETYER